MNINPQRFLASLLFGSALLLGGCQNGLQSISEPISSGSEAQDIDLGLDIVNKQTIEVEKSINDTISEIDSIINSSAMNIGVNRITDVLLGNFQDSLKDVLTRLTSHLDVARDAIDRARERINDKLDQIDTGNPAYAGAVTQLRNLLSRLDELELRVDLALDKVRGKADDLIVKVDNLIAKLQKNPIVNFLLTMLLKRFKGGVLGIVGDLLGV